MRTLFSKVTVELTTDEVMEINELIKKATAKGVRKKGDSIYCPSCDTFLYSSAKNYCTTCGQRIDRDVFTF